MEGLGPRVMVSTYALCRVRMNQIHDDMDGVVIAELQLVGRLQ